MVDAIVSTLLEQLMSVAAEEAKEQVRLVTGVGKEVEKLTSNLQSIQAVLNDAEQKQFKEQNVRLWLDRLKDASYDMEDVLDEWITARLKLQIKGIDKNALKKKTVCSFFLSPCFGFKQVALRRDIALKIKEINENLNDIAKAKHMFNFNVITSTAENFERIHSTSLINVSDVRGRGEEKNILKTKLLKSSKELQIISLVGMGGIGKTTLAQFVYNDNDVKNYFDIRMWVCVSDPFDESRVAKAIIESIEGSSPNLGELNSLLLRIEASIARKRFFLVLDDVWTEDRHKWEPFHNCLMNGHCGSKILVTTRKETVAKIMESTDVISIKELSKEECWSLFKRFAFFGRPPSECEQIEEIGKKIVGKCKGLPLAVKTIGSMLCFKRTREEWQSVLDSEMWQLEDFEKGILVPLLLSYNDLPSKIKRCFSYCAAFPKDSNIGKDELIKLWMALGYIVPKENKEIEMIGEEYFDYLASRSFFQEFKKDDMGNVKSCKMHDIVQDFAQYLTKSECVVVEVDGEEQPLCLTNTSQEKLRHLMLGLGDEASFPDSICNAKKLRSLLIGGDLSRVQPGLFAELTCLRALTIVSRNDYTEEVFEATKKFVFEGIKKIDTFKIPCIGWDRDGRSVEIYCELFNLQTLVIYDSIMKRLPQGIGKLVNLRHLLYNGGLEYMLKGIERLTCLRTLNEFVVSPRGKYGSKACNLEGIRNMNHLRGTFIIRGLENLKYVNEAKIAHLEKKNLVDLQLFYDYETEEAAAAMEGMNEENEANHEAIGEALRPPPNIESLSIRGYQGKIVWPSWMVSLYYLKKLRLFNCDKFEILPPLGKLPSLEILEVWGMSSVKRVGDEFLGIERDDIDGTSSSVFAFPKLKQLSFYELPEWEEWNFVKEDIEIMPQLNSMTINACVKLKSVPDQLLRSTTLTELSMVFCPILQARFKKRTGKDWSKISHIRNVKFEIDTQFDWWG